MAGIFDDLSAPSGTDPEQRARELSRPERIKRFYKDVSVVEEGASHGIRLDGRPIRTPARKTLALPTRALAEEIAAEWQAQETEIDPATMPLNRLANSTIDGIIGNVAPVLDEIARYAGSDLVLYRADGPERLVARQSMFWDPIVAWAAMRIGVAPVPGAGVMHIPQPGGLVTAFRAALPDDPYRAAALHTLTTITGSAFLALAVAEGRITADQAFEAANVDEDWNFELWGEDEEALQRRSTRKRDLEAAARLLHLV